MLLTTFCPADKEMDVGRESEGIEARCKERNICRYKSQALWHFYIHGELTETLQSWNMVWDILEVLLWYIGIFFFHVYHVLLRKGHLKLCLVKYLIKIII